MEKRGNFSNKIGFVLAAAGSAVGLGNIWRFPYLAAKYGGGTFLLVYLILAVTFGFSLMIAEIAIGRKTGLSAIGAFKALDKRFGAVGYLAAIIPIIIFPYYSVIGGWVIKYLVTFCSGGGMAAANDNYFGTFAAGTAEPLIYFFIFIAFTALVVWFGVEKGIEKIAKYLMPLLFILMIFIIIRSLMMPGSWEGMQFLFSFNWEQVSGAGFCLLWGFLVYCLWARACSFAAVLGERTVTVYSGVALPVRQVLPRRAVTSVRLLRTPLLRLGGVSLLIVAAPGAKLFLPAIPAQQAGLLAHILAEDAP